MTEQGDRLDCSSPPAIDRQWPEGAPDCLEAHLEEVTFEQRLEGGKGVSLMDGDQVKNIPNRGKASAKVLGRKCTWPV